MTEEKLFQEALALSPEDRAPFLEQACTGQPELLAAVVALLLAHEKSGNLLDRPLDQPGETQDSRALATPQRMAGNTVTADIECDSQSGTVIAGRYILQEKIGEGGMGEVWVAKQTEPIKRKVAIKLIKAGMDTRAVLKRFEQERQALALMDHPNISRVLDGGMTGTGQPYFVMELVNGLPINRFCDDAKLNPRERLELFVPVCHAVQHAHQKGIVHRDLKPANILVTMIDGRPVPKVIDFGVAKATSGKLIDESMSTGFGAVVGTLEYMAPEQAGYSGDDIDTRADIYSLGVVLYELLTGLRPFDSRRLRMAALTEMIRIIREVEPSKPSTRLSTHESLAAMAAVRHVEPRRLMALLRGELDWVVMKCLEKPRERRYESANGLARDIQRYLDGDAVEACPPSTVYRLKKFITRNKGKVTAAAIVTAALLLGLIGTVWQANKVTEQRDLAILAQQNEKLQREAADQQRDRAVQAEEQTRQRAGELQKVADFQAQMLEQVDPTTAGIRLTDDVRTRYELALEKAGMAGNDRSGLLESFTNQWSRVNATDAARELIDTTILKPAVAAVDRQFVDQPVVAADLREALARRYFDLGLFETALTLEQRTLTDRRRWLGEEHPDTINSIDNVGALFKALGRYGEAEPFVNESLKKRQRLLGEDHADTLTSYSNLGNLHMERGRLSQAESILAKVLEKRKLILGDEHEDTLNAMNNLATLLEQQGKYTEAEVLMRDVLNKRRLVLGEDHPDTLLALNNYAGLLRHLRKMDQAIECFRELVEKQRRMLGDIHPSTLNAINSLGSMLGANGFPDEGEELMRESLANRRRLLGSDHPSTLNSLSNLAVFLIDRGETSEAEPMCRESLQRRRSVLGENHPETLIAYNVMGYVLRAQKKNAEAVPFARETAAVSRRVLGPVHPDSFLYAHNLALLLSDQNQFEEAEKLLRDVIDDGTPAIGIENPIVQSAINNLAQLYRKSKDFDEAIKMYTEILDGREAKYGRNHHQTLLTVANLGLSYKDSGNFQKSIPLLEEAYEASINDPDLEFVGTYLLDARLGGADPNGIGDPTTALVLADELVAKARKSAVAESMPLAEKLAQISSILLSGNQWVAAEPLLRECLAIREANQPDGWSTFNTRSMLGGALHGQEKFSDAEPLLLAGYDGMKAREPQIPPQAVIRISQAIERLIQLYQSWDKAEPGQGLDAKAAEWMAKREELNPLPDSAPANDDAK